MSKLVSRTVYTAAGGRSSMRLLPIAWDALALMAAERNTTPARLVATLDDGTGNRTASVMAAVLTWALAGRKNV